MRTQALAISAVLVMLAAPAFAQVTFDVHIGQPPPPPRVYRVPPQPGPDYVWVEGYWYPQGHRYRWHDGYWTRAPYPDAYWISPYYEGDRYYAGHWEGGRGDVYHNHRWDRDERRDEGRSPRRGRGRGRDRG